RRLHQRRPRLPDQAARHVRRLAPRARVLQLGRERGAARGRPQQGGEEEDRLCQPAHAEGDPALHPQAAGAREHHRQPVRVRRRPRRDPEPALLRGSERDPGHRRAAGRAPGRDADRGVHRSQPRLQPAADPLVGGETHHPARRQGGRVLRQPGQPRRIGAGLLEGLPARARREARGHRQALRDQRRPAQARQRHPPDLVEGAGRAGGTDERQRQGVARRSAAHVCPADSPARTRARGPRGQVRRHAGLDREALPHDRRRPEKRQPARVLPAGRAKDLYKVAPVRSFRLALAALLLNACALQPQAPGTADAPDPVPTAGNETPAPGAPAARTAQPPAVFEGERQEIRNRLAEQARIDRTAPVDDVWQRIRNGFAVPDLDNALVREKTRYYAARPEYMQRIVDRSRLYLYHIVEEIEKRGMPTELALLPMVESAFNPMAYSRAHASGLWQFIPGTGKRFELEQNWWYDARRDIVESTNAALDYLAKLYEMHGDWQLALASYNWGENAVARAIAKNQAAGLPTDYASLSMPAETRQYIPKLQALKNIIANPEPFGIVLGPIPNQPYFTTI